jgi:gamma-glutamyl phosphate reductase
MARLTTGEKNAILLAIADAIAANSASIIEANRADLADSGIAGAMRDRLLLTP